MNGWRYLMAMIFPLVCIVSVQIAVSEDKAVHESNSGRELDSLKYKALGSLKYCLEMRSYNGDNTCTRPSWPGVWMCESGPLLEREARCVKWDVEEISKFCSYWSDGSRRFGRAPKKSLFSYF